MIKKFNVFANYVTKQKFKEKKTTLGNETIDCFQYVKHLAATALTRIFGIRRRRACLGMPTDGGRRNTMWRCTNDRQRGCKMFMGLTTVEKQKIQTLKTQFQIISMFLMTFYSKKYLNVLGVHMFLSKTECYH